MIYSKNEENNIYITLSEASKISGISRDYLNVLIHREKLRAIKIGKNWLTTKAWISECKMPNHIIQNQGSEYLSLFNAAKIANVSSGYLNVAVRRGKLQAVKLGRNWFTTSEWLSEYQKSVGREITQQATHDTQRATDNKIFSKVDEIKNEEKYELRNLKSNLILGREKALETKSLFPEIKIFSRELKIEEKENVLKAARFESIEQVKNQFKKNDLSNFEKVSRQYGISSVLKNWSHLKFAMASGLAVVVLTVSLGFASGLFSFPNYKLQTTNYKLHSSIFSDVVKSFSFDKLRINPGDLTEFSKWLTDSAGKSLTLLKSKTPSELVVEGLEYGESKISVPEELSTPINTFADAEALDAPSEFLAKESLLAPSFVKTTEGQQGETATSGSFTLLENRLSSVEARLDEELALTNSELTLQKKTIIGALETLFGVAKLVPSYPISTFVVQGQPATLTSYSVSPSVHTGFDRLAASYLSLSRNAEINGSLTVKSGGIFNTISVSGNTTLTGDATIGGTLNVTGDTTLNNLTLNGTLSLPGTATLGNASSTYLTVSSAAWLNQLKVTGTATTTFNNPITSFSGNFIIAADSANNVLLNPYGGNVGIGTSSPNNLLTIAGATTPSLGLTTNSGLSGWTIGIDTADANKFKIASSTAVGTNARLTIDGNGNVGIGTTSPGSLFSVHSTGNTYLGGDLTVSGTVNFQNSAAFSSGFTLSGILTQTASSTSSIISSIASSTATHFSFDARGAGPVFNILKNNSSKFYIDNLGNIGIATTTFPSRFGFNIATSTFVYGNQFISGGLGVGLSTTTSGAIQTSGDVFVGRNLFVSGSSVTLGASTADSLTINSSINSNLIPDVNATRDLGSSAFYWDDAFINTLTVNNLSAASSSVAGTQAGTFTINSDNNSADAQNAEIIFYRGTVVPNALFTWNSATSSKRFEMNQVLYINNGSASTTNPSLTVKGIANQTADILKLTDSSSNNLFTVSPYGAVNIATSTYPSNIGFNIATSTNIFGKLTVGTGTLELLSGNIISNSGNFNLVNSANNAMTFYTNNSERMRIDSSGLVGIGTTTPGQLLSVNGNGYFAGNLNVASSTILLNASTTNLTVSASTFLGNATTTGLSVNGGTLLNSLSFGAATGTSLTVTGGSSFAGATFSGNVGIGTTSPSVPLEVVGSSGPIFTRNLGTASITGVQAGLQIGLDAGTQNAGAGPSLLFFGDDSAGNKEFLGRVSAFWEIPTNGSEAGAIAFNVRVNSADTVVGIERMRISSNGNVGIGTTTPGQLLSVNGNGYFAGNLNVASSTILLNASTTNLTVSASTFLGNATTTGLSVNGGTLLNSLSFGAATGTSLTVTGGALINSLGLTNALTVANGGTGATTLTGLLQGNGTSAITAVTGTAGQIPYYNGTNTLLATSSVFLATSGNVGIGTTAPRNSLVVSKNTGAASSDYLALEMSNEVGAGAAIIFTNGNLNSNTQTLSKIEGSFDGSGATSLRFYNFNGEIMRVSGNNNVGIGTTTPGQLLSVNGNGFFAGNLNVASSTTLLNAFTTNLTVSASTFLGNATTTGLSVNGGTLLNSLSFGAATGTSLTVTGGSSFAGGTFSGNVGIGTTAPRNSLVVSKNTGAASSDYLALEMSNEVGAGAAIIFTNGNLNSNTQTLSKIEGSFDGSGATSLRFYNFNGEIMRVSGNNNVGIGTTTPGQLLSVNGNGFFAGNLNVASSTTMLNASSTHLSVSGSTHLGAASTTGLYVSGNVGIASTSPSAVLSVNVSNAIGVANALNITSATSSLLYVRSDGNVGIGTTSPTNLFSVATTSNIFNITRGGNIGIGAVAPSAFLHVIGGTEQLRLGYDALNYASLTTDSLGNIGIKASNLGAHIVMDGTNSAFRPSSTQGLTLGSSAVRWSSYYGLGLDLTAAITTSVDNTAINLTGTTPRILFLNSTSFSIRDTDGIRFATFDSTGTPNVMALMLDGGNVGIGTTTPNNLLTISGETTPALSFTTDTGNGGWVFGIDTADANKFKIASSTSSLTTNTRLTIDGNGNVGIGTSTPTQALSVQGNILTSGCLKVKGAADTGTCVDLAESFPISESVEAGDIIMLDLMAPTHIKKATGATTTNNLIIGVVSTQPSILINGDSTLFGGSTPLPFASSTAPVALVGRVPVKVSLENGPIIIGDRISASSVAGVGKKASSTEATVGIALEAYDGWGPSTDSTGSPQASSGQSEFSQIGKVLVFVNLGQPQLAAAKGTGDLASMTTAIGDLNMDGFALINVKSITGLNNLWKIDENGNIIAQSVETQKLTVTGANSGVTVYDRGTSAPKCIYIEGGVVKTSDGACGSTALTTGGATTNVGTEAVIETTSASTTVVEGTTTTPVLEPILTATTTPEIITTQIETATSTVQ